MTDPATPPIRLSLSFSENDTDFTAYIAVPAAGLAEARSIFGTTGTPLEVADYFNLLLESHIGGKLDRDDGPALVLRKADGSSADIWCRDGEFHRVGGPARILRKADGAMNEEWFTNGKRDREGGPAFIGHKANGTILEIWYRGGKRDRANGPAVVARSAMGTVIEQWFHDGKFVKQIRRKPGIPGKPPADPAP